MELAPDEYELTFFHFCSFFFYEQNAAQPSTHILYYTGQRTQSLGQWTAL